MILIKLKEISFSYPYQNRWQNLKRRNKEQKIRRVTYQGFDGVELFLDFLDINKWWRGTFFKEKSKRILKLKEMILEEEKSRRWIQEFFIFIYFFLKRSFTYFVLN